MTEAVRFHYRLSWVAGTFLGFSVAAFMAIWNPYESTYLRFLDRYPGRILVLVSAAVVVGVLIYRLPTFVRAVARIPAVQYDGRVLLVRGWEDRTFATNQELDVQVDEARRKVLVSGEGEPAAVILLRDIAGPGRLVAFLKRLADGSA